MSLRRRRMGIYRASEQTLSWRGSSEPFCRDDITRTGEMLGSSHTPVDLGLSIWTGARVSVHFPPVFEVPSQQHPRALASGM
jgi:hypothetical protein